MARLLTVLRYRVRFLALVGVALLCAYAYGNLQGHHADALAEVEPLPPELVRHRLASLEAEVRALREEHRGLGWTMAGALGGVVLQLVLTFLKPRGP